MRNNNVDTGFASLSKAVDYYQKLGYTYAFMVNEKNENPEDWCLAGYYRFEGASNPSDNSIVYLLHKKDGAAKGLLVNAFGIYSSDKIDRFIERVINCN